MMTLGQWRDFPVMTQGHRAGRRARCLVIGLFSLLLAGCSLSVGSSTVSPAATRSHHAAQTSVKLTWAPPPCDDRTHHCATLYLKNTGSHQTPDLDNNTDYRIYLPADGPLVGGITIIGGRNVQIIGGEIDLTYPCSNDASDCTGLYIAKNSPGSVFVEGVWIRNPSRVGPNCPGGASSTAQTCSTGHGIDVNTADNGKINVNTITLENIRVDGISGCSGYDDHADVFQPYQAPDDTIRIDRMTGVTNCQGLVLDPDLAYSRWHTFPASITIQNTNVDVVSNPYWGIIRGIAWWLTWGTTCTAGPISLTNDYSNAPRFDPTSSGIWPDAGTGSCGARQASGVVTVPDRGISGSIRLGVPAGGDFVPRDAVGLGYRSPGYR
jgi:hypothetical protein